MTDRQEVPAAVQLVADMMDGDWTEGEHPEVSAVGYDTYTWVNPESPEDHIEASVSVRSPDLTHITVFENGQRAYEATVYGDGRVFMADMWFHQDEDGTWVQE